MRNVCDDGFYGRRNSTLFSCLRYSFGLVELYSNSFFNFLKSNKNDLLFFKF